ncbi:unnamed protein product [Coccothraustes coccothraustes]
MARGVGERTGEDADRKRRRERRAGGAQPSAAEVVPPLGLLAPCAARGRDGPRPPPGRARAQLGRAGPGRAAPPPNGGRVLPGGPGRTERSGAGWFPRGGARLSRLWSPHLARQWAAVLRASSSPAIPVGHYLRRQVEAEPEESRRFPLLAGSTVPFPGQGGSCPRGRKAVPGKRELPSDSGSFARPRPALRSASCRCFQQSPRVLGKGKGPVAPISFLNQLPVLDTVCVKEEHPATQNQDELLFPAFGIGASPTRLHKQCS